MARGTCAACWAVALLGLLGLDGRGALGLDLSNMPKAPGFFLGTKTADPAGKSAAGFYYAENVFEFVGNGQNNSDVVVSKEPLPIEGMEAIDRGSEHHFSWRFDLDDGFGSKAFEITEWASSDEYMVVGEGDMVARASYSSGQYTRKLNCAKMTNRVLDSFLIPRLQGFALCMYDDNLLSMRTVVGQVLDYAYTSGSHSHTDGACQESRSTFEEWGRGDGSLFKDEPIRRFIEDKCGRTSCLSDAAFFFLRMVGVGADAKLELQNCTVSVDAQIHSALDYEALIARYKLLLDTSEQASGFFTTTFEHGATVKCKPSTSRVAKRRPATFLIASLNSLPTSIRSYISVKSSCKDFQPPKAKCGVLAKVLLGAVTVPILITGALTGFPASAIAVGGAVTAGTTALCA